MRTRVSDKVDRLLAGDKELRDSDKKLLLAYWEQEGLHFSQTQREIFMTTTTPAESVTRARRELKVKYPASKKIDDKRYELFQKTRNKYSGNSINFFRG